MENYLLIYSYSISKTNTFKDLSKMGLTKKKRVNIIGAWIEKN